MDVCEVLTTVHYHLTSSANIYLHLCNCSYKSAVQECM